MVLPMGIEIAKRAEGSPGSHAQAEVIETEEAAAAAEDGHDPYATSYAHGPLADRPLGTKTHFPYLPAMLLFGLPRAVFGPHGLTDARIFFVGVALALLAMALMLSGAPGGSKFRAFQVVALLPGVALDASASAHDLVVVSLTLLSVTLAERREPVWSAVAMGVAAAMKQTAWVLLPFLLLSILRTSGRRALARAAGVMAACTVPLIGVFFAWHPGRFVENTLRFPLGVGHERSSAATPSFGSWFANVLPGGDAAAVAIMAIVVVATAAYLLTRPLPTPRQAAIRGAVVMAFAMLFAPA